MHNFPCATPEAARRLSSRRGSTTLAVLLLSLGVGASTAAFTFANGVMPHSAPFVTCETMMGYTSDYPGSRALSVPAPRVLRDRMAEAYETSYEAAGDAVDSWSNTAGDIGDLGGPVLAMIVAAGALALLDACTRRAARALATPRTGALAAAVALGALPLAALVTSAFGLPALGLRAVAFGVTVSMVAAYAARAEWKSRPSPAGVASE